MLTRSTAPIRRTFRPQHRERIARRAWSHIVATLRHPCSYRHAAGRIRRIETHISVIYLAERLAAFHRCASTTPPHSLLGTAIFLRTQMETVLTSLEREAGTLVPAGVRQWCEKEAERLAGHF